MSTIWLLCAALKPSATCSAGPQRGQRGAAAASAAATVAPAERRHKGTSCPIKPADRRGRERNRPVRARRHAAPDSRRICRNGGRRVRRGSDRNDDPVVAHAIAGHAARHMAAVAGHAIAARGDALDQRGCPSFYSLTRSSATRPGPIRAACAIYHPHCRRGGVEGIAAAREHRTARAREHIARTCGREPGTARPGCGDTPVGRRDDRVGALVDHDRLRPHRRGLRAVDLAAVKLRKGARELAFVRGQDGLARGFGQARQRGVDRRPRRAPAAFPRSSAASTSNSSSSPAGNPGPMTTAPTRGSFSRSPNFASLSVMIAEKGACSLPSSTT